MGLAALELDVTGWQWRVHVSRKNNKEMLAVAYYGGLTEPPITEYFTITHEGRAGQWALQKLTEVATKANITPGGLRVDTLQDMVDNLQAATPPKLVRYKREGRFFNVISREW
jgi:hypothetical protein